jgi:hypothetical protein
MFLQSSLPKSHSRHILVVHCKYHIVGKTREKLSSFVRVRQQWLVF